MASERALLVATGGGIGDTLLAGVVARALHARFDAVDAVVLPAHADIASHVPSIARVIPFGEALPSRYGAAVVTWATLRTALLPWRARVPVRVGQARRLYSPLFTQRVVVRSELGDRATHWTEILLDYARAIGCDGAGMPEFAVRDDERAAASALLHELGISAPYIVLHPTRGLSAQRSRWPASGFARLARRLADERDAHVVVTGSRDDAGIAGTIARDAGAHVTSIAGRTPIGVFGAVSENALAVVAMDSGPMHVAAAVGAPTTGVFALQSDEPDRWAPRGPRVAIVRPTYPCPPGDRKETCPDFACVRELDVRGILTALDGLLAPTAER